MKLSKISRLAPTLALIFAVTIPAGSNAQAVQLAPPLQSDPLVLTGTSGGSQNSDCGYISEEASQAIEVTQQFPYLRLEVESAGEPTLLIEGPAGRFCVLADSSAGEKPQMTGLWVAGTYKIYVGDRAGNQYSYRLLVSQQPN